MTLQLHDSTSPPRNRQLTPSQENDPLARWPAGSPRLFGPIAFGWHRRAWPAARADLTNPHSLQEPRQVTIFRASRSLGLEAFRLGDLGFKQQEVQDRLINVSLWLTRCFRGHTLAKTGLQTQTLRAHKLRHSKTTRNRRRNSTTTNPKP